MTAEPPTRPQGQVARNAYKRALKTYKESLSAKEYAKITVPATLEDVFDTTSTIQERHKTSKTRRLCDSLKSTKDHLERFGTLIEAALKDVVGGELLWASISFVFVVASDSAETFAKLLEVLVTTSEKMPQFTILADSFGDSALVIDSVEALYVAIIKFWVAAAKFYRKKRLWRLAMWNDYEIYFRDLVNELDKQERRLRDTAQVQHMHEAKEDREESRQFRRQTTFGRMTANKIIKWMSPADIYEPNFFELDFEKANKKRHQGTCEWILRKNFYKSWEATPFGRGAMLVIYGIPGAGKTVLSSFLVHHCLHQTPRGGSRIGLYFFFDNKDEHKRSPLAVSRSLVYQLYSSLKSQNRDSFIRQELELRMQSSATDRAMNYDSLWAVFRNVIQQEHLEISIVLDAMDECNGSKPFIRDLKKLVANLAVRIIVTSRSENHIVPVFAEGQGVPTLFVTTNDVKRDIISYVQAKVEKNASLQHPQVKDSVVTALATKSGGMFLWVYLMLKVLKSLPTVSDVLRALSTLPEKLDDVYKRILEHLYGSLKPGPRAFCQLVLKWIVATSRPLLFTELVEGLKAEYNKTSSMFDQEQGFQNTLLYGRKDIELVCGSLVTVNEDSIRLIHLSTRDYLRSSSEDIGLKPPLDNFLVDVPLAQNRIALTCLEYLGSSNVIQSLNFTPAADTTSLARQGEIADISERNPLFEYAVLYWPTYIFNNTYSGTVEAMKHVADFLCRNPATTWLEVYLLFSGPEYTSSTAQRLAKVRDAPEVIYSWADIVTEVLDEYATTMTKAPWMIHKCFQYRHIDVQLASRPNIQSVVRLPMESNRVSDEKRSLTDVEKGAKSWVYLDSRSKTIFMTQLIHPSIRLASQQLNEGIRYRPAIDAEEESPNGEWAVRSVAVRQGGSHIAVTYCPPGTKGVAAESLYRTVLWLINDPSKQTGTDEWAERILVDKTRNSIFRCPVADSYITEGRGNVVSFGENGTLITPGGIYNIFTEEKLNSPSRIFQPSARITSTSFNGHRVARIRDLTELEVLSLDGQLIGTFSFKESEVLQVCTMGFTGQKIVMTYCDVTAKRDLRRIQCVHVASSRMVRLQSPGVSRINFARFTANEERLVGRISCNPDHSGSEIAVWNVDSGSIEFLFKDPDPQLSFCLHSNDTMVLIISSTGRLITRGIEELWNGDEETEFNNRYANQLDSNTAKSLWQIVGSSTIYKLSCVRRNQKSEISSSDAKDQGKPMGLSRVMNKISRALNSEKLLTSSDTIVLERRAWRFNTEDSFCDQIQLKDSDETNMATSSEGNVIAAMGKFLYASDDALRQIPPPNKQKGHPQQAYLSPHGRFILTIEEKSEGRLLQAYSIDEGFRGIETYGSHRIKGYIMDLNVVYHECAPLFAVTYTTMSPYSGGMDGKTLIVVISDEKELSFHHISGTYHPSLGFSHCGKYFFGTLSMEEAEEIYEEYNDEASNSSNSKPGDAFNTNEPNFDEPTFDDELPAHANQEMENTHSRIESNEPEDYPPPINDTILQETDDDHSSDTPSRSSLPSGQSDTEVGTKKYPWPKLYKLPSELRYPVLEQRREAVKFKLGSFYTHAPYICRLRLSENMGILYLDKLRIGEAVKVGSFNTYSSRVLCVIPDDFLDLSTTEIVLVWPQNDSTSMDSQSQQSAEDTTVKVVLFPSGRSNVPVLINTGLQGPTLLDF